MRLVYPPDRHETFEKSTFFMGSIAPGNSLTVKGEPVPVSKKGFFSHQVELNPGENRFVFSEWESESCVQKTERLVIYHAPQSLTQVIEKPSAWQSFVLPQEDIHLKAGARFTVGCLAPQQVTIACHIDGITPYPIPLNPINEPVDNRQGVFAQLHQIKQSWPTDGVFYTGSIILPLDLPAIENATIQYEVQTQEQYYTVSALGKLSILPQTPQWATVNPDHEAICRTSPEEGARLTPILPHTQFEIMGYQGEWAEARLDANQSVWLPKADLQLISKPYPDLVKVPLTQAMPSETGFTIQIPLSWLPPMLVDLAPDRIRLTLFQAASSCDFIHYLPGVEDNGLSEIRWHQTNSEQVDIEILLNKPLLGFTRRYDPASKTFFGEMKTSIKEHQGFTVVIDPGHGGSETGSTAPEGSPEKELNLLMALKLRHALSQHPNINVRLTREHDIELGLAERVLKATQAQGDLLISLHHNALPDGRSPLIESGVSSYYYYPFALPLAKILQKALVNGTDFQDYGILYDSLALCRVMAMPAILLELGFLTHPQDAEQCLDTAHQDRVIQALVQGILAFRHDYLG